MILYYSVYGKTPLDDCIEIETSDDDYSTLTREEIAEDYYFSENAPFESERFFVLDENGKQIDSFIANTEVSFAVNDLK